MVDYDDDSEDDEPQPPPVGFAGVYGSVRAGSSDDDDDEDDPPPPPPEGFVGVFRPNMGGGNAAQSGATFPPQRPASFPPPLPVKAVSPAMKGSARQWTEQKLAQQKRGGGAVEAETPAEYDEDEDSEMEEEASQYMRPASNTAAVGSSEDESAPASEKKAMRPADREKAQQMAMLQAGDSPSAPEPNGKKRLDQIGSMRNAAQDGEEPSKPPMKRGNTTELKKGLGRWGTGGEGVRDDGLEPKSKSKGLWGILKSGTSSKARSDSTQAKEPPHIEPPAEAPPTMNSEVDNAAEAEAEASGVPPVAREGAVHGWVFKRGGFKSKSWKKRYCVYEPRTKRFTYYDSDVAAGRDMQRKGRVHVTQSGVVKKASARSKIESRLDQATGTIDEAVSTSVAQGEGSKKGPKYEFKFNTAEGRVFEVYCEKAQELRAWLEAMPHWEDGLTMVRAAFPRSLRGT